MKSIFVLLLFNINIQLPWIEIRDLQDRFLISFPKTPEYKHQEIKTELGIVENESYFVTGIKDYPNYMYVFNILSYSYQLAEPKNDEEAEEILQNTILDLGSNNKMQASYVIVRRNDFGVPYAEVRYLNQEKNKAMRAKIYLYRYRMVIMQVFMPEKESINDKIGYFFNSYKNLN